MSTVDITFTIDDALLKIASYAHTRVYYKRLKPLIVVLTILAVALLITWLVFPLVYTGLYQCQWVRLLLLISPFLVLPMLLLGLVGCHYWVGFVQCRAFFNRVLAHRTFQFSANSEGLTYSSESSTQFLKYKRYWCLCIFNDVWLLYSNPMTYHIIPLIALSSDDQQFIKDQLTTAGVAIVDYRQSKGGQG